MDALFFCSLDWRSNVCLSGKLVCLPTVVFSSFLSLGDHLNPGVGVLTLCHQLLAVSYCVMDAYGDELLTNDLGQARSLEQTDYLAARVGEDWLDVVGLQVAHPLLWQSINQSNYISILGHSSEESTDIIQDFG